MAEPSWQELLRQRLVERNNRDSAFSAIIEQYRKLAQQTNVLKERNASLLRAVGSVRGNPSSSTVFVPGVDDNPVRAAYVTSLESQITTLKEENNTLHKQQNQYTLRLLSMNETLREKEELARAESDQLRKVRDEVATLRRKVDQHNELMSEKDRTAQILHDEISTLQLELGQIDERNSVLMKDNAKLLQRWLDAKQSEVNKMNQANEFYEDMRSRHQAVVNWRDDSGSVDQGSAAPNGTPEENTDSRSALQTPNSSVSGNGSANGEKKLGLTKDGIRSQPDPSVTLNPNG